MKGYDIDGVITAGIVPERNAVIVTGRSYEQSAETYAMLRARGIHNAVFFSPMFFHERNLSQSGKWKAFVIGLLGITEFYEDSEEQALEILAETHCLVYRVMPDGTVNGIFGRKP